MFILLLPGWRILTDNFEKINKIEVKLAKLNIKKRPDRISNIALINTN